MLELLSSLVEKSLVTVDFECSEPRYGLLEPFRQYGREKLVARREERAVAHRHALVVLALVERASRMYNMPHHSWIDRFHPEKENIREAIEWALGPRGDVLLAQRLVGTSSLFVKSLFIADKRRWIARAFEAADESTPLEVLTELHLAQADNATDFRDFE